MSSRGERKGMGMGMYMSRIDDILARRLRGQSLATIAMELGEPRKAIARAIRRARDGQMLRKHRSKRGQGRYSNAGRSGRGRKA